MASLPNVAVVLNSQSATMLSIDLNISTGPDGKPRTAPYRKSMVRPKDEAIQKTLDRLRLNLQQEGAEKGKKGKKMNKDDLLADAPAITVEGVDGAAIDTQRKADDVWRMVKKLRHGQAEVPVLYNVPTVTAIKPPPTMHVGVPAVCSGVQVMFAEDAPLVYEWRKKPASSDEQPVVVGKTSVFIPEESLLGHKCLCRCRVDIEGSLWSEVETPVVAPAPEVIPMARWVHTTKPVDPPAFRVVSYNILHDAFCTSKFAQTKLYPFCLPEYLDLSYRKGRIAEEVRAYNADIVCFQECGKDIYKKYYKDVFASMGFDSEYNVKTGNVSEGCAILYGTKRFTKLNHSWIPLSLSSFNTKTHADLRKQLAEHPHLEEALSKVTSIGAITVLKEKESEHIIIVSNAHLFYHPWGCHIRVLQAYLLFTEINEVYKEVKKQHPNSTISKVMCGDYNASRRHGPDFEGQPPTATYQLATTGVTPTESVSWTKGMKFWWGVESGLGGSDVLPEEAEVAVEDAGAAKPSTENATAAEEAPAAATVGDEKKEEKKDERTAFQKVGAPKTYFSSTLRLPKHSEDDEEHHTGFHDSHIGDTTMQYTNYGLHFKDIIDHIFVSKNLEVLKTIPLPTEAELSADVAIPSKVFPSDHVAIIADLKPRQQQ